MVSPDAVAVELMFARLRRFPVTSRWLASSSGALAPHFTRLRLYLFPLPPGTIRCLGTRRDMLSPIGNDFSKAVIIFGFEYHVILSMVYVFYQVLV